MLSLVGSIAENDNEYSLRIFVDSLWNAEGNYYYLVRLNLEVIIIVNIIPRFQGYLGI